MSDAAKLIAILEAQDIRLCALNTTGWPCQISDHGESVLVDALKELDLRGPVEPAPLPPAPSNGELQRFAARLADAISKQVETILHKHSRGARVEHLIAAAIADSWCDLAAIVRKAAQP